MPNARPKSNTFLFFGHDRFTACESRCSPHYATIYIFHKVTTSKSVRSRAVKITKFLLLAVKNLLIFTSISCPLTSFVASSSQNSRKSAFLRTSIDRDVKGDSLRANSKPPTSKSRLSLGDESPRDEFIRSKLLRRCIFVEDEVSIVKLLVYARALR